MILDGFNMSYFNTVPNRDNPDEPDPEMPPEEEDKMHQELADAQEERYTQEDEYVAQGLCRHGKQHGTCEDCNMENEFEWYMWREKQGKGKRIDDGYSL